MSRSMLSRFWFVGMMQLAFLMIALLVDLVAGGRGCRAGTSTAPTPLPARTGIAALLVDADDERLAVVDARCS